VPAVAIRVDAVGRMLWMGILSGSVVNVGVMRLGWRMGVEVRVGVWGVEAAKS